MPQGTRLPDSESAQFSKPESKPRTRHCASRSAPWNVDGAMFSASPVASLHEAFPAIADTAVRRGLSPLAFRMWMIMRSLPTSSIRRRSGEDLTAVGQTSWTRHTPWRERANVRCSNLRLSEKRSWASFRPHSIFVLLSPTHRRALAGLALSTSLWQWRGNFFWRRSHSGSMLAVLACDKAQALV